jgi:2-oxoglutarate ferredoxin oxidoreductase subunit delta
MPGIIVDGRYCKGCGLCVEACPFNIIVLDPERITEKGYHPAMLAEPDRCNGCATCAVMCPDVAIKVER